MPGIRRFYLTVHVDCTDGQAYIVCRGADVIDIMERPTFNALQTARVLRWLEQSLCNPRCMLPVDASIKTVACALHERLATAYNQVARPSVSLLEDI